MNQIARLQDREIAREKQTPDRSAKSDQSGKITKPLKEGERKKWKNKSSATTNLDQ